VTNYYRGLVAFYLLLLSVEFFCMFLQLRGLGSPIVGNIVGVVTGAWLTSAYYEVRRALDAAGAK
jgi:hypothetical protein